MEEHYKQCGTYIDPMTVIHHAPFAIGCCIKYILRAGYKGGQEGALKDLKKAIDCYMINMATDYYGESSDWWQHERYTLSKFKRFNGCLDDLDSTIFNGIGSVARELYDAGAEFDDDTKEFLTHNCDFVFTNDYKFN